MYVLGIDIIEVKVNMNKSTTMYQDAIRIIFILVNGSVSFNDESKPTVKGLFRGKARLYAMDFWVRYPDYLAHELILKYEETEDVEYLKLARDIFFNNEPDLRRIPMIRFLFGAYQNLENILAVLISKGLISQSGEKSSKSIHHYDFFINQKAYNIIEQAKNEFSILDWYDKRSKLVVKISGEMGGSELKNKQYKHIEYAKTKLGGVIPSIKDDVLARIEKYNEVVIEK